LEEIIIETGIKDSLKLDIWSVKNSTNMRNKTKKIQCKAILKIIPCREILAHGSKLFNNLQEINLLQSVHIKKTISSLHHSRKLDVTIIVAT
jgi:hypothetical protein